MIFMMLGRPGGGKSYESVVYHVIPALKEGRKVITNLPLKLDYFKLVYGEELTSLIEVRQPTKQHPRRFKTVDEYGDQWTHPETGVGPLYVIDECHEALRRGRTEQAVEEWFARHRHSKSDVLLITQSHRKIDVNICDLVDIVYTVGKATALGSQERYIRTTKTGVRGTVLDTQIRSYDATYFPFYQSHTASSTMGKEATIKDVKPIWKNWQFAAAAVFLAVGTGFVAMNASSLLTPHAIDQAYEQAQSNQQEDFFSLNAAFESFDNNQQQESFLPSQPIENTTQQVRPDHPYSQFQIRVSGHISTNDRNLTVFRFLQNGQTAFMQHSDDMVLAGYDVELISDCLVHLTHGRYSQYITCGYATVEVIAPM